MPLVPKRTEYNLVKAFLNQGRVESNVMKNGVTTHRFTTNPFFNATRGVFEKASCHVRGLTDEQAADSYLSFYDEAKNISRGPTSLLSEEGRRMLQARIIRTAGAGTPGVIRVHESPKSLESAVTPPDQNTVTLDALRAIADDASLSAKARGEAMHHLLHVGALEVTPAMVAAMAYTAAMDKATKARR